MDRKCDSFIGMQDIVSNNRHTKNNKTDDKQRTVNIERQQVTLLQKDPKQLRNIRLDIGLLKAPSKPLTRDERDEATILMRARQLTRDECDGAHHFGPLEGSHPRRARGGHHFGPREATHPRPGHHLARGHSPATSATRVMRPPFRLVRAHSPNGRNIEDNNNKHRRTNNKRQT